MERHQTLRAAIEWSYSLLDDTERTVFDRLGVFPASFDEAAAVAVCTTDGVERWDVIDALARLVAKSMIGAERDRTTARYQLLETLRHFARDRADDLDGLRRRHATHYAAVAEQFGAGFLSDLAVIRASVDDTGGAARALATAVGHLARSGDRAFAADAVAVAVASMVFAGHPDSLGAAATLEAARDGPVLGPIPPGWARIHQPRIDAALDHIATSLDQGAYASARQRGAAMTYDEIIAFTLDQLARIAAQ